MTGPSAAPGPVTARIRLPDQSAIRARGLVVRVGGAAVVDALDLAVPRNQLFGLSGRAGSGVAELCAVVSTRMRPDDGDLTVLGHDVAREPLEVRAQLGHLPSPFGLPPNLHLDEYLCARAGAQGVARSRWPALVDTLLDLAGLAGRHKLLTHDLDAGQRQLLGIAGALVHDPTVLLLEEPTAALDDRDRARVWNLLHRLIDVSRSVVVASRHLPELASGCATIAVLDRGHLLAQGAPNPVIATLGGARRIRVRLANGAVRTHTVADADAQTALLRKLVEAGLDIVEFSEVPAELDDLNLDDRLDDRLDDMPGRPTGDPR